MAADFKELTAWWEHRQGKHKPVRTARMQLRTMVGTGEGPGRARRTSQKGRYLSLEGWSQESKDYQAEEVHNISRAIRTIHNPPGFIQENCRRVRKREQGPDPKSTRELLRFPRQEVANQSFTADLLPRCPLGNGLAWRRAAPHRGYGRELRF